MSEPGPDPALAAAAELAEALTAMTAELKKLGTRQKRQRRLVIGLIISFTLDAAFTAGLAYTTIRQNDIQAALRASDVRQCQLSNIQRTQDVAIWDRILQIPDPAKATAAQRAEVKDLERLVRVKDTPRDCNAAFSNGK